MSLSFHTLAQQIITTACSSDPLFELAGAMGIEMKLITADEAYNYKDGSILADTGVHLITPVSKSTDLPEDTYRQ